MSIQLEVICLFLPCCIHLWKPLIRLNNLVLTLSLYSKTPIVGTLAGFVGITSCMYVQIWSDVKPFDGLMSMYGLSGLPCILNGSFLKITDSIASPCHAGIGVG